MPVSVSVVVSPPNEAGTIRVEVRTQGLTAVLRDTVQSFWSGVTGFFDEPVGSRLKTKAKRIKRVSVAQERRSAESMGGRRQSGSGAKNHARGDGRVPGKFRFENKFTTAASFSMKLKDLRKLRSECAGLEQPVFEVEFREKPTMRVLDRWVLIDRKYWEQLEREANQD